MRDDPVFSCASMAQAFVTSSSVAWSSGVRIVETRAFVTLSALVSLVAFGVGFPYVAWLLALRYRRISKNASINIDRARREFERVEILVGSYRENYFFMEAIGLLHRLFFTG